MLQERILELHNGFETAYIDGSIASNLAYKPKFISNNYKQGKKVLSFIEDELLLCDKFQISVAFITMSGITPLLQTLKELEKKGIKGEILTTNYLNFSEPRALKKLNSLSNITLKMYDVEAAKEGFHTKGYIFRKEEIYRIIIGSSNITSSALTSNREWNTRVISTEKGEVARSILKEFHELWHSEYALEFEEFYEIYQERYKIIKNQREIAHSDEFPSIEKYRLQPNSMQVAFIVNLKKIIESGEKRALLISATGTGKTYASAFAMRELGYKRVLFLVHRGQLARQTKKSYQKILDKNISMGLVGAGCSEYEADYVFATVQTLNRDEHLHKYNPEAFECIILDEAHHSSADTYQKVMNYFKPKLWLGDRVKGLIFCSRIDESEELSQKFNAAGFRTTALNGSASDEERTEAFERLAMDEEDATEEMQPLDYIFSVEILNEGVDIVEVNQVIMLRPTKSPIVFIQQLGRGLRKAKGKEYVVVLDFIGNYNNNFMIPVALSGDRTYNQDIIKKYVISGNATIPGASTVHFDEIAKNKIFASVDKIKGMKSIIKSSYRNLKNRLGQIPYLVDFYENGEVDPLVIIREYKIYQAFLESEERELCAGKISEKEKIILEYLSKTVLSGARPYELEILKHFMKQEMSYLNDIKRVIQEKYECSVDMESFTNAIDVLQGHFVSNEKEYKKYSHIDILNNDDAHILYRMTGYAERLKNMEFCRQIEDIIEVGLRRYQEKYQMGRTKESPFVLYEKYSRRDVSLLMNCGKDLSSTMYGMKRIGDDVFIFVTYHKEENEDDAKSYVDGKPDYADVFEDNIIFRWDSQIGRGVDSSYMKEVCTAARKHLLVKKSDAEVSFYYMGMFDIIDIKAAKKKDNNGKNRDIAKVKVQMKHPVRTDLLRYLQSDITIEGGETV